MVVKWKQQKTNMIRNISIGIEVGTAKVRAVVGEFVKGEKNPKVIGVGESESRGLRHGYVLNAQTAAESIRNAVEMAEKSSGIKIKRAALAVGGVTLLGEQSSGEAVVSKADGEVTSLDIDKALEDCENNLTSSNKKILRVIPLSFKLDGREILGRPEGSKGTKLEAKALFITCSSQHFEDLMEAITQAGVEPTDVVPSPVACVDIALSDRQKMVGAVLVDIGSETVTMSVFENETMTSLRAFSIGSSDITNDIALGMKVPLEKAEELKLGSSDVKFSDKKLEEIVEARLSDIFELIENHLKKIKRNGLLPAGAVFVGGGANTKGLEELAKKSLQLPARVGSTEMFGSARTKLRDPAWFTVLGLLNLEDQDYGYSGKPSGGLWKGVKNAVRSGIKQLMP